MRGHDASQPGNSNNKGSCFLDGSRFPAAAALIAPGSVEAAGTTVPTEVVRAAAGLGSYLYHRKSGRCANEAATIEIGG